jgi:hypothetical protein
MSVLVPTRWWLWPLTGPFYGWLCAMVFFAFRFVTGNGTEASRPPAEDDPLDRHLTLWTRFSSAVVDVVQSLKRPLPPSAST